MPDTIGVDPEALRADVREKYREVAARPNRNPPVPRRARGHRRARRGRRSAGGATVRGLMPRMATAVPYLGYIVVTATKAQ